MNDDFRPHHIDAEPADLEGNGGRGRFLLLPGSDGRAEAIARSFDNLRVLPSPRRHTVYLGTLDGPGGAVDVGTVATGMGCPSVDIIVSELFHLGARCFLRVGTAGSLQPERVKVGDIVVATAAVRDEGTSSAYLPPEVPAVASLAFVHAAEKAVDATSKERVHFGLVHTKDSLFAREFGAGPRGQENRRYMAQLEGAGVLASEMEAAHLFILASLFSQQLFEQDPAAQPVLAGAVLGVIGGDTPFADEEAAADTVSRTVRFALATIGHLAASDSR